VLGAFECLLSRRIAGAFFGLLKPLQCRVGHSSVITMLLA
jgi:hypothetical protein